MKGRRRRRGRWERMNIKRKRSSEESYRRRRDMSPVICSNVPNVVVCIFF